MPRAFIFFLIMIAVCIPDFGQYEYDRYEPVDEIVSGTDAAAEQKQTNKAPILIPLFSGMKAYYAVDPQKPQLPLGHWLLKIRGSVWRSQDQVFFTNARGVVSAQHLYIFFAVDRDAVAFEFAPYAAKAPVFAPVFSEYMVLDPLLQTNLYRIQPYQYRNLSIESPYSSQVKPLVPQVSQPTFPPPFEEADQPPAIKKMTESEDQYETQYEAQDNYQDEYNDQEIYYPEYEETAFEFVFSEQGFVAQQVDNVEQIVVNVGGLQGGIFVHENKNNKETPYTVFFLMLEPDGSLWSYSTQTSFDIRTGDSDAVKNARILYEKTLRTKANLEKFIRIRTKDIEQPLRFFK